MKMANRFQLPQYLISKTWIGGEKRSSYYIYAYDKFEFIWIAAKSVVKTHCEMQ